MSGPREDHDRNVALAQRINTAVRSDPNSPYSGRWVGILHGEVVVVGATLEEVVAGLEHAEPGTRDGLVLEATGDSDTPDEIWKVV